MSKESEIYANLGASSSKDGVLKALGKKESTLFAQVIETEDPNYYSLMHSDGVGTKSICSYIAWKETSDTSWFKKLAIDSLIMNIDDIACINAFDDILLSNTIGRNFKLIPDQVITEIINGYVETCQILANFGINIRSCGGETADLGDIVRTLDINSTVFAKVKKNELIDTKNIKHGDIIIGLSSTGKASYEKEENSGISSNGLTMARAGLIHKSYFEKYPEIIDPNNISNNSFKGNLLFDQKPEGSNLNIAELLTSPTRTFAPIIKSVCSELKSEINGIIHCTGGGQRKIAKFGINKKYVKNNFFPIPIVFQEIQKNLKLSLDEMYSVFNMGHRIEIITNEKNYDLISEIAKYYNIESKVIGHVQDSENGNSVEIVL